MKVPVRHGDSGMKIAGAERHGGHGQPKTASRGTR